MKNVSTMSPNTRPPCLRSKQGGRGARPGAGSLLPATVQEFVDKDHLARFVLHLVVEAIDLEAIERVYRVDRGQPPFDPAMMTALLLYAYCNGVYSSWRIAKACRERVDFMSIVGLDSPDFRTISEFRKRHLQALSALFGQVLRLCERAGLVKLGHVALDGTKIKANASKHKAMSYADGLASGGTGGRSRRLDGRRGGGGRGRGRRLRARQEWRRDAGLGRRQEAARRKDPRRQGRTGGRGESRRRGRAASSGRGGEEAGSRRPQETRKTRAPPSESPEPKAQKNFTDPESRIMKTKDGFIQGYNSQAAVDAEAQVIVVHGLDANSSDQHHSIS
jgi:transposase